jgi:hypothetical protein
MRVVDPYCGFTRMISGLSALATQTAPPPVVTPPSCPIGTACTTSPLRGSIFARLPPSLSDQTKPSR